MSNAKAISELATKLKELNEKTDALAKAKASPEAKGVQEAMKGSFVSGNRSDSLESRTLKYFGVDHPAKLLRINTEAPKFARVPEEHKHAVKQLKEAADVSRFIAQIFQGAPADRLGGDHEGVDYIARVKGLAESSYAKSELVPRLKAFGSTVVGGGDEWVPTLISQNYIEEYQLDKVLESRFQSVNMPSNPYEQPVQSGLTKARIIAENTAISGSNFTTSKLTFSATKLGEYNILPEELTEDSAPDVLGAARAAVLDAQIRAVESAILNGDNDGTHIDSDTQAAGADVAEKAWKGLRRQALANSANGSTLDFGNAAITEANLRTLRGRMKKFGVNPSELLMIIGPVAYQQLLGLTSVATVDKFGPNAAILKGALSAYQAIPIVISEHMRENLSETGVYDGVTTNRAGIVLVNMRRWWVGIRRPIMVKAMADLPNQDRFLLASYQRKDFQGMAQGANEVSVAYGYNIAV